MDQGQLLELLKLKLGISPDFEKQAVKKNHFKCHH
ncbi:Uncharacterised protein [Streptococcus pneumoniae]|nr:Uncharacterised protein [Streptococcus pneumoniae]